MVKNVNTYNLSLNMATLPSMENEKSKRNQGFISSINFNIQEKLIDFFSQSFKDYPILITFEFRNVF